MGEMSFAQRNGGNANRGTVCGLKWRSIIEKHFIALFHKTNDTIIFSILLPTFFDQVLQKQG